jgi:dihydrofolate synthase/folylpolyglutamate synthase
VAGGRDFNHAGDRQQWRWAGRGRRYNGLAYPALRGANQLLNAAGVLAAFEACATGCRSPRRRCATAWRWWNCPAASRSCRASRPGAGRGAQPAVGGGAGAEPRQMGFYPRTHAVFGAMRDKDLAGHARRAFGRSSMPGICATCHARAPRARSELAADAGRQRAGRASHPAREALAAAAAAADPADRIVVFGSFYTVGGVLKDGVPRLTAPHVG